MGLVEILVIVLSCLYVIYIVSETIILKALRKRFKHIIHVNGIRGKSTTVRLIDSGLRECGFKVYSKTTGTIASTIDVNNSLKEVKRLGSANIREQIKTLFEALKCGADTLVIECMAVNPELQKISEEKILRSDITLITNVRRDHFAEMGDSLDELAYAMSTTIPKNGVVITGSKDYFELFNDEAIKRNSKCILSREYNAELLDTFSDNIAISLEVCEYLGLDKEKFFNGMKKYKKDFGAYAIYKKGNTIFLNGLSINDSDSIKIIYNKIIKEYDKDRITILLNSRYDRPSRALQHLDLICELNPKKVLLLGSSTRLIEHNLKKRLNDRVKIVRKFDELLEEDVIYAIGNFHGMGLPVLKYFMGGNNE